MSSALFPRSLRGVFAGAGSDGLAEPAIANVVLGLAREYVSATRTKKTDDGENTPIRVAYLGTATYDLPSFRDRQTGYFREQGCEIIDCNVAFPSQSTPFEKLSRSIAQECEIILVSGGNTLYAVDRWKETRVTEMLRTAMERGAVLCGGSAGAICWFDGGHSDSMDPASFASSMVRNFASKSAAATAAPIDESALPTGNNGDEEAAKAWEYIRIDGVGLLPGLICPHHDKIQSNGVLRADDFDAMLRRHPNERGVCIDHWAAIAVSDGKYRVVAPEGKEGYLLKEGNGTAKFDRARSGTPAVWIKEIGSTQGEVKCTLAPSEGDAGDLFRPSVGPIVDDARVDVCRAENRVLTEKDLAALQLTKTE